MISAVLGEVILCRALLVARYWLIALDLAPPAPLLLLLVVLTRVLAQLGLYECCVE